MLSFTNACLDLSAHCIVCTMHVKFSVSLTQPCDVQKLLNVIIKLSLFHYPSSSMRTDILCDGSGTEKVKLRCRSNSIVTNRHHCLYMYSYIKDGDYFWSNATVETVINICLLTAVISFAHNLLSTVSSSRLRYDHGGRDLK